MNQAQVQVFRLLLRNLQASLVDLSYDFSLKYSENPEEKIVVPLILSIDDSLRSILSTFSEKTKCEVVHNYFSQDYLKIIKFKEKYEPILIKDIQQLKNDFILFLKQELSNVSESTSSNIATDSGKFEILIDQINSILKDLDEPFNDISSPPFAVVNYFLSFKTIIPFDERKLAPLINRGNLYIYFFRFLRQLRLLENYKNRFEDGDIPSDCSQHFVEANYVPDQVQSTKVIMPLVKTQKTDPSIQNWSVLPKESSLSNVVESGSGCLKGKFAGLKLNGLFDSPNNNQLDAQNETNDFEQNGNGNTIDINQNDSNSNSQINETDNILSHVQNTDQPKNNINDVDMKSNYGNQKNRVKGSKLGTVNTKNLSNLKLGSKSTLAMLQRSHPKSSKKSENANNENETNNNDNNDNTASVGQNKNPKENINSSNNIFTNIKGIPNINDNSNDDSNDFLEDYKKGVVAINNNVYDGIKSDTNNFENDQNNSNFEDGDSTLNRYMQMVQKLETSKQQIREWSQIIIARLQQKALLLQKENQLLRENLDIVSKQKTEIVEMYETQINELSEQNEFMRNENMKLKEKVSAIKNDE